MPPSYDKLASASAIYAYAGGDPVNMSDPNGHHWVQGGGVSDWQDSKDTWHNHGDSKSEMNSSSTYKDGYAFGRTDMSDSMRQNYLRQASRSFLAANVTGGLARRFSDPWGWGENVTNLPGAKPAAAAIGILWTAKKSIWSATKKLNPVENVFKHWKKHGSEFPDLQNAKQYVDAAKKFTGTPPAGTLTKVRPDGSTVMYNTSTNTFAIKNANGVPQTMFKPDPAVHGYSNNMDYFDAQ